MTFFGRNRISISNPWLWPAGLFIGTLLIKVMMDSQPHIADQYYRDLLFPWVRKCQDTFFSWLPIAGNAMLFWGFVIGIGILFGIKLRKNDAHLVFDMRGFWADEKVEAGSWPQSNPLYRLAYRGE